MAATIRDVAAHCGLSVATVSKVFHGYRDVSRETCERVQRAARELGYYPHALARSLQASRSYCLGVAMCREPEGHGGALTGVLEGFRAEAATRGYDVLLMHANPGGMGMTVQEQCRWRRVDGVCLLCADFLSPDVAALAAGELPCVTVEYVFNNRSCVQSENAAGMQVLVEYAASLGHRRIALVHGQKCTITENRLLGFHRGMQENGLDAEWLVEARYASPEAGYEAVLGLMRQEQKPSCILMPDDESCLGAFQALEELKLRVPEDVSVAGFGGMEAMQCLHPRLTTIDIHAEEIGRSAAALLLESLTHPRTAGSRIVTVPVRLLPGESLNMAASDA